MERDDPNLVASSPPSDSEGPDALVGSKIADRYSILARVAKGGTAVVYRALDTVLNREVAVKIIHEHLERKEEIVERFKKEAVMIAQLRHPNIVTVYDFLEYRGRAVLVVEFMPGITLSSLVNSTEKISEDIVLIISLNILNGLRVAHEKGMTHRDIKPANILINSELGVKISDFGLAKLIENDDQLTNTGIFVGTPSFSSPEQIEGRPLDHRSDIFSLGLTMYMLATRSHAFKKKGDSTTTVWYKTVRGTFDPARERNPALSAEFERILNKALEVSVEKRYQTAEEMIRDIDSLLRSRGIQLYQQHLKAFLKDPNGFKEFPDRGVAKKKWSKKNLVGLALLSLVGAAASLFFPMDFQEPTPYETPASNPAVHYSPTPTQEVRESPRQIDSTPEMTPEPTPILRLPRVTLKPKPAQGRRPVVKQTPIPVPDVKVGAQPIQSSGLRIPKKVSIVNMTTGELPPLQVHWAGETSFSSSEDSNFNKIIDSGESETHTWTFKNLKTGSIYWKGGAETGEVHIESYTLYRSMLRSGKRPLVVSSAFGDVDLELNPWLQQIRLMWDSGPDANAYRVEVSRNPQFTDLLFSSTAIVKNATIERYWDSSQVIYWRISYFDETQNVFLIDPIRKINLKVTGQPPYFDLVEPNPTTALKVPDTIQIKAIGPAKGKWSCASISQLQNTPKWEPLKREGGYYLGRIGAAADTRWIVCQAETDDTSILFSMPTRAN